MFLQPPPPPTSVLPMRRPKKKSKQRGYWKEVENRKTFFFEFARGKGFDPYIAENWKAVTKADIIANKVSLSPIF